MTSMWRLSTAGSSDPCGGAWGEAGWGGVVLGLAARGHTQTEQASQYASTRQVEILSVKDTPAGAKRADGGGDRRGNNQIDAGAGERQARVRGLSHTRAGTPARELCVP